MTEEIKISDSDRNRITQFIKENELDYQIVNASNFHIDAHDGISFYINKHNEQYILIKYDPRKEQSRNLLERADAYLYFSFQNLQQIMEQLSLYDSSLPKMWWELLDGIGRPSSINMTLEKESYKEDWSKDIIKENWKLSDDDDYKYAIYEEKRNIKVISPHNTLHEVSLFNEYTLTDMEKLYFEIHPILLSEGNETFLVKILINNEEIMKEYINYRVRRKKGLKLFIEDLLNNNNPYIQLQ